NSSASYKAVNLGIKTRSSITIGYPGFVYVCGLDGYLYCIGDKTGFSDNKKTNKLPSPSFSISPNPFSSRLTLSLPSSGAIYSLTGQLIMKLEKGKHSIDTSSWREGVYIVKAGKESKRVVKVN
ncbi:MAG: T9SS type A sorting domain-containing protein, partial [Candidatus Coatesbacteria bacterium]|nr:T9SS type A sorting domain-containing protein [Candidatus Coatesbacteria bacterium]